MPSELMPKIFSETVRINPSRITLNLPGHVALDIMATVVVPFMNLVTSVYAPDRLPFPKVLVCP